MTPPAPPPPTPRRSSLPFLLAAAAVLLALPAGYVAFLGAPPAVEDPAAGPAAVDAGPTAAHPLELTLREAEGQVQVRRGSGPWEPASPGATLRASDAVRTGDGALAVLVGGEEVEVRLEAGTEVSVEELTDSLSRVLLEGGMATTRVRGGAGATRHTFEVRASGSDAVARTDGGVFTMSSNGQGTVAVGTAEGEVQLRGAGKVVIVRAGQGSLVRPGQAPETPAPLPASLLLKVQWPTATTVRQRRLRVAGQAEPGAHVEVAGHAVRADAQGRFTYDVPLREGAQKVQVRAVGVGGRQQLLQQDVTVDTTPPRVGIDPELWK